MGDAPAVTLGAPVVAPDDGPAPGRWHLDLGASSVPRRWAYLVLGVLAVLSIARSPHILRFGRFWAEEGTLHFARMVNQPGLDGLGYVQTRTGYLNLFANGSTWLAEKVPLEQAPLVTVWLSFAVVLLLAWIALTWPSDLLPNAGSRIAAAVLLVVGTGAVAEVWLNTINAQTYLCLITLLILFVRVDELSRARVVVGLVALAVAGLSGLYSVALAPLFLVVALLDRRPRRWACAAVLTLAGAVQAWIFLNARSSGALASTKAVAPEAGQVFRGIGGWHLSALALPLSWVSRTVTDARKGHTTPTMMIAGISAALVVFLVVLLWRSSARRVAILLGAAFVTIEALVQLGAHNGETGGRYALVPIGILVLMVVHGAACSTPVLRVLATVLGSAVLVVGVLQFYVRDDTTLRCHGCPDWSAEVAALEQGDTKLAIWPYPKGTWFVEIEPSAEPAPKLLDRRHADRTVISDVGASVGRALAGR